MTDNALNALVALATLGILAGTAVAFVVGFFGLL